MFNYCVITLYCVLHIVMIIFNSYLVLTLKRELSSSFPMLFDKIKRKLLFFFGFIITILLVRIGVSIPIFIEYHRDVELVVPALYTIILCVTEILPVMVLMFSFIMFGSSSNDDLETMDTRLSEYSRSESMSVHETFRATSATYLINNSETNGSKSSSGQEILTAQIAAQSK